MSGQGRFQRIKGRLARLAPQRPDAAQDQRPEPEAPPLGDSEEERRESSGGRLQEAGAGARSALAAGGRGIGRGAAAAGERISRAWFALPIAVRQRLAAGLALLVIVLLVIVVLIPNAPCSFPGGDRCPPPDDAIELAPADAGAYLHLNLDRDTDQLEAGEELAGKLPGVADTLAGLLPSVTGTEIDFERDVRPWSGGEVALIAGAEGIEADLALLESADNEAALAFAADMQRPQPTEEEVGGITIRTDKRDLSSALIDGFLALGSEDAVRAAAQRAADPGAESLADDPEATEALGELPDERLAEAFVSAELAAVLQREGTLGTFNTFVNAGATRGFAAALVVGESSASIEVRSLQDPDSGAQSAFASLPAFEPKLPESVSADTYVYLGLGDPGGSARSLLEQAASVSKPLQRSLEAFTRRLGRTGGADLEDDLLPLLDGESALTVEPKTAPGEPVPGGQVPPPYLALLADSVDGEQARSGIAGLQSPIAKAIDPSSGQTPVFETSEIDGVEAQSLRLSPSVDLTYAAFDDKLVVGSDPIAVARAREVGESLADSDLYEDAVSGLPDEVSLLIYLDAPDLLALGEQVLQLPLVPAYAALAPSLRSIDATAVGVSADEQLLATDVRVEVGEPVPDEESAPTAIEPG